MWKVKEIADKVTNVVMNYTEPESKVREATNDQAWGPHGSLMSEIAQLTSSYEAFPEVMGMLWKRMFHENRRDWRRVYKSLLLLAYLLRNGSERVVSSAREHTYDMRQLETYTFTDEHNRDQGVNVRTKVKEILELVGDDERLREERKKARKLRDKYVGVSGGYGYGGFGGGGYGSGKRSGMDDIDSFDTARNRRMNTAEQALDKVTTAVKDLWSNRPKTYAGRPDDFGDEFHDDGGYNSRQSPGYRDDFDDLGTHSSKSVTSPTHSYSKKADKFDEDDDDFNPRGIVTNGASKHKQDKPDDEFADFSNFGGDNSNTQQGEFADFAAAPAASFPSPPSGSNSPAATANDIQPSLAARNTSANLMDDLQGLSLNSPAGAEPVSLQPSNTSNLMGGDLLASTGPSVMQPIGMGQQPLASQPMGSQPLVAQPMGSQLLASQPISSQPLPSQPMGSLFQASQPISTQPLVAQPLGAQYPSENILSMTNSMSIHNSAAGTKMGPSLTTAGLPATQQSQMLANSTWNNTGVKVNIDLDNLGRVSQKTAAPSMNQLASTPGKQQGTPMMHASVAQPMMQAQMPMGMAPQQQGRPMGQMSAPQGNMMMGNTPMMGMPAVNQSYSQTGVMQQTPQQRAMQQRADSAFAGLGALH
ncbi:clathrin interactor 1-like isoform X2 [Watersipora subatra]|uniref:clathrin interactor 1-like isoform X2 n=1 Tax=Watersipora subatra TaxID=2589382 RepID=UPI00355C74FF